jgi:hypothetical protein
LVGVLTVPRTIYQVVGKTPTTGKEIVVIPATAGTSFGKVYLPEDVFHRNGHSINRTIGPIRKTRVAALSFLLYGIS